MFEKVLLFVAIALIILCVLVSFRKHVKHHHKLQQIIRETEEADKRHQRQMDEIAYSRKTAEEALRASGEAASPTDNWPAF